MRTQEVRQNTGGAFQIIQHKRLSVTQVVTRETHKEHCWNIDRGGDDLAKQGWKGRCFNRQGKGSQQDTDARH